MERRGRDHVLACRQLPEGGDHLRRGHAACSEMAMFLCADLADNSRGPMTKRNLIIIHRGPAYVPDFDAISAKVRVLDADISVHHQAASLGTCLPDQAWQHPTLTVALTSVFKLAVRRGPVLRNHQVEKLVQQALFRKHGIPTPPALPFHFGMKLDPILFGEFVVLKPMNLFMTSRGVGIHLLRRRQAESITLDDFPADHLIRGDHKGYIVQKFIDTGEYVADHRVATFFGRVLYANCATAREPRPELHPVIPNVTDNTISGLVQQSDWRWHADADVLELARKVHAAFPGIPLLGIDILRQAGTGKLFVLECNPGGNTWHFSSSTGRSWHARIGRSLGAPEHQAEAAGRKMLLEQFSAFDRVAEALVEKTRTLAE